MTENKKSRMGFFYRTLGLLIVCGYDTLFSFLFQHTVSPSVLSLWLQAWPSLAQIPIHIVTSTARYNSSNSAALLPSYKRAWSHPFAFHLCYYQKSYVPSPYLKSLFKLLLEHSCIKQVSDHKVCASTLSHSRGLFFFLHSWFFIWNL